MKNTLQSWLDEILSNDNDAKSAPEMMDVFALAKGIPGEVAAFLFGIRPAGAIGRSNAETNLDEFDHLEWGFPKGVFDVLKKPGKAGARPDRKCRFGFSWEDVEDVAEEYAAGQQPCVSWRRREARKRAAGNRREMGPVPSPEEIRRLLADNPAKAVDAIKGMDYLPESLEQPFSPRELLVSDLICDRSLPRAARAQLLRSIGHDRFFDGLPPIEARDAPIGFLDSKAGRKWYCEQGRPGCEVVRCSDPAFFRNVARKDYSDDVDAGKVKIDPKLRKAIDADSPAQLMMQLTVSGKKMDARLLSVILALCKTKMLEWLLENDEKTREFLDERRMLFYVCANWKSDDAAAWLEKAEAKEPGIIKSCVDPLGRNLLWYTLYSENYNWLHENLVNPLVKYGCDPDADTAFRLSWRDMEAVR